MLEDIKNKNQINDVNIEDDKNKKEKEKIKFWGEAIITIIIAIALSLFSLNFFRLSVVDGHSMDNTLYDGERILLNTFIYNKNNPEHGDIVVVERLDLSVRYFIKRVIAVSGDSIEIKDNTVYLNGEALEENYIKEDMYTDDKKEIVIPEGKVFVMGDNRNNSLDSRSNVIGLVDIENEIMGKAIYNLSDFKPIK